MPEVLSPTDWNARVDYDLWTDPYTPDEGVVIHHGGGGDYPAAQHPFSRTKEMSQLRSWEAFHIDGRGWRGLAYGWAIGQTGTIYRIRGFNRYGAHLGDIDGDGIANNEELIPIIWILSGLIHRSSQAMQDSTAWLRGNVIEPKAPQARQLYGHREVQDKPTTCPGPLSMVYVESHRFLTGSEQEDDMDQVGKAVVDIAFDMKWASGDRTYWYGKDNDDPEIEDLRKAIRQGAAADRIKIDQDGGGGLSEAEVKNLINASKNVI